MHLLIHFVVLCVLDKKRSISVQVKKKCHNLNHVFILGAPVYM
jgi:hypothetical protein